MTTIISDETRPNACETCPRTGCSLFDGRCGLCAFGIGRRNTDEDVAFLRMENARLEAELRLLYSQNARLLGALRDLSDAYSHMAPDALTGSSTHP